jgi:biopolymer transport protein ExbB
MEIQERLTSFAMMGATWVMWLLIGLSIIGMAILLERAWSLSRTRDDLASLRDDVQRHLRHDDVAGAQQRLAASPSYEARIAAAGLEVAGDGADAAEERMQGATQLAKLNMEKRLAFLGTIGANAPFVGLLGTVIGIIRAFHELDSSGGKVTSGLMSEVGEALVATAIGILVALPAVAAFNWMQRIIKARIARGDALGREVLAHLKAARS